MSKYRIREESVTDANGFRFYIEVECGEKNIMGRTKDGWIVADYSGHATSQPPYTYGYTTFDEAMHWAKWFLNDIEIPPTPKIETKYHEVTDKNQHRLGLLGSWGDNK